VATKRDAGAEGATRLELAVFGYFLLGLERAAV
jgi:hypothetical protein